MSASGSGGYLDSSFDGSDKKSGGGYSRKPMGDQTLRPVTIKQIKNSIAQSDSTCQIDNTDVTNITLIGVIRKIQDMQTHNIYTIEDGTGVVECKKWFEQESATDADSRRELLIDIYVRVFGRINHFNSRITVVAHHIRPIKDFNEISYHFLDAIETHLIFTKPNGPNSMLVGSDAGDKNGSSIENEITRVLKEYEDIPDGASIDQICHKLAGLYTEDKIKEALENMHSEGAVYSTMDSEHYKSCYP